MKKSKMLALVMIVVLAVSCFVGCDENSNEEESVATMSVEDANEHEHIWQDATCVSPKMCMDCGEEQGEPLEHNYLDGYCDRCGIKDPNYPNLKKIGFSDNCGMNIWLEIKAYSLPKNRVTSLGKCKFKIYNGNYWQTGWIEEEKIKTNSDICLENFSTIKTQAYNLLSNDVIQYDGAKGWGPISIIERVVDSENKRLIIKTQDETGLGGTRENWYVPIDLLDFSTLTKEGDSYCVNFLP